MDVEKITDTIRDAVVPQPLSGGLLDRVALLAIVAIAAVAIVTLVTRA